MSTEKRSYLGHEFVRMGSDDYETFAGADEGSWICYATDEVTLVIDDAGTMMSEIITDVTGSGSTERSWRLER